MIDHKNPNNGFVYNKIKPINVTIGEAFSMRNFSCSGISNKNILIIESNLFYYQIFHY